MAIEVDGKALRAARRRAGLTTLQLARASLVPRLRIEALEAGASRCIVATVERLARVLDVPVAELLAAAKRGPGRVPAEG